ncbi:hypothetical protein DQ04_02041060 [Trypanosoma grayi]|uniref:hypothetical protein n=1 Tax=Trypanosoma grayi TaxID=71804 RepID=UPI0004F4482A|nr:hypothetical protein DQ04_02041060 [Trypanosoma grayi]KEG12054.1 hypothetical protein DQ04_02041060 [Trypanosoma grayi]
MPSKRVVVNLSENYGDIRIPCSLLPGANAAAYSEQAVLFMAPLRVGHPLHWCEEYQHTDSDDSYDKAGAVVLKPAPPLDEEGIARASLPSVVEPPCSPAMRGRFTRAV